jgi:hypothetical protein
MLWLLLELMQASIVAHRSDGARECGSGMRYIPITVILV